MQPLNIGHSTGSKLPENTAPSGGTTWSAALPDILCRRPHCVLERLLLELATSLASDVLPLTDGSDEAGLASHRFTEEMSRHLRQLDGVPAPAA